MQPMTVTIPWQSWLPSPGGRAAVLAVVAENGARIVKRALLRLEFFEKQHDFAVFAIEVEKWDDEYGLFKTARQQDFVRACRGSRYRSGLL